MEYFVFCKDFSDTWHLFSPESLEITRIELYIHVTLAVNTNENTSALVLTSCIIKGILNSNC